MAKLRKTFNALMAGTALTAMMVTGTVGLATPHEAEASQEGVRNTMLGILGAAIVGGIVYNKMGGSSQTAIDPSCARNYTTTTNSGSYYNQSTTQSVNCPPAQQANYAQQQQIIVQPQKSQAEIQLDQMRAEQLAAERQKLQLQNEADFYASIPKMRLERETGFCMNVNDPQYLDADNRKDCPNVLNRTKQGQDFLASVRPDLLKNQRVESTSVDQQCASETVKESYGADGKMTGRTIEKTMKPCKPM